MKKLEKSLGFRVRGGRLTASRVRVRARGDVAFSATAPVPANQNNRIEGIAGG